jgi:hypothetical protein
MWYSEDKNRRVVIRHVESDWETDCNGETGVTLLAMRRAGMIEDLSYGQNSRPRFSNKMLCGINRITMVELQERDGVDQGAWRIMSVGYAFCQKRDQFNKKEGRKIAFARAIKLLPDWASGGVAFFKMFLRHVVSLDI